MGIVHGLAGSAGVALLVLTQIHEPLRALVYLLLFGVGTMAGMTPSAIAVPVLRTQRLPILHRGLQLVAGALSLGLGCYLAWDAAATASQVGVPPRVST